MCGQALQTFLTIAQMIIQCILSACKDDRCVSLHVYKLANCVLAGIPITHQHLIWQSVELEDEYCLHDYSIQSGATLKLVLAMRGGPINTRRSEFQKTLASPAAPHPPLPLLI